MNKIVGSEGHKLDYRPFFKVEFVGEMNMCTFLSLSREKYQKSATQGRLPWRLPYGTHHLCARPLRPGRGEGV